MNHMLRSSKVLCTNLFSKWKLNHIIHSQSSGSGSAKYNSLSLPISETISESSRSITGYKLREVIWIMFEVRFGKFSFDSARKLLLPVRHVFSSTCSST